MGRGRRRPTPATGGAAAAGFPGPARPRLCSRFPAAPRRSVQEGGGSHKRRPPVQGRASLAAPGQGRAGPGASSRAVTAPLSPARAAPATHQPRGSASPLPPPRACPETAAHVSGRHQRAPPSRPFAGRSALPPRSAGAGGAGATCWGGGLLPRGGGVSGAQGSGPSAARAGRGGAPSLSRQAVLCRAPPCWWAAGGLPFSAAKSLCGTSAAGFVYIGACVYRCMYAYTGVCIHSRAVGH